MKQGGCIMRGFTSLILFILILFSAFSLTSSFAQTDSVQVRIVNTRKEVGSFRFIVRDSSNLILRVMDNEGNAFKELLPNQVEIFRENEQAKIIKVTPLQSIEETNLNVVLALDNSSSMQSSTKELLSSVNLLLYTLRDKSQIAVVLFDESSRESGKSLGKIDDQFVSVKFSNFFDDIQHVMDFVRWNYNPSSLSKRTYLYDMILVGLQQFEKLPQNLLRVMIVLSDGQDLGSKFKFDQVLQTTESNGITIYSIDYSQTRELNETLQKISAATPQGKIFRAEKASDLMPVFETLSKEIITEFQVTFHFPIPPSGKIDFAGDSLYITARNIVDEFPMLNYVFFDSNSVEIDERYHLFSSQEGTKDFEENKIQKSLDKYYHILNIIGSRARSDSTAKLTISGCNMNLGAEKGNLSLSEQRAQAVSRYLQDIWGISPNRIKIQSRNLPQKRSSISTPEGQAENRRVEITSDHYYILRPIRSEISEFIYNPQIGYFNSKINTPEGLKQWEFYAYDHETQLIKMTFETPKSIINWNWIDESGEKVNNISHIDYFIKITDQDGRIFESRHQPLPVSQTVESTTIAETKQDTVFEKFSLVLFDFNSSKLSESNQYLLQRVLGRYNEHPDATMKVYGYCDNIGSEEYNSKLSTERAKMTYNILVKMKIPKEQLSYLGYGEINPIFSNSTPEGRFLNRTVQIHISYPKSN
jgi:outer membrane protein OmpA-like peptidoglycan-associated protein